MNAVQKKLHDLKSKKVEKEALRDFSEYITQVILNYASMFYTEDAMRRKEKPHLIASKELQKTQKLYINKHIELEERHFNAMLDISEKAKSSTFTDTYFIYINAAKIIAYANIEVLNNLNTIIDLQDSNEFMDELEQLVNKHSKTTWNK